MTDREAEAGPDQSDGQEPESDHAGDVPLDIVTHEGRERPDGGTEIVTEGGGGAGSPMDGPDADAEEAEPVEVLVSMAEDGEIEPWDIDVVVVTDKFLERIDDADLRTSGRTLFYASVLLRMKSDALLADDEPDDHQPEPDPFEPLQGEEPASDPFAALESEMDRRLDRKRARGTPQTLDELVRELRDIERNSWWKDSREYDTSDSPRGFQRGTQQLDYRASDAGRAESEPTAEDVTGATHGEDVDQLRDSVAELLAEHFAAGRDEVLFAEIDDAAGSRVETFLGLLFLADRDRVRLVQDVCFGDLWIRPGDKPLQTAEALEG